MFQGKKVLITGGTGSLGQALTKKLLSLDVETIRIFSREEWKQFDMQNSFDDPRLRFLIGDVSDKFRLERATEDIDIVIHAAALKHVPIAEYNPFEAVKTNIFGSQNLIDACLKNNVKIVLAVGTDKAVSPLNTYGATKFLMERLFVSANFHKGQRDSKFICVRYGNVLGSRGSVVPTFIQNIKSKNKIKITDNSMTRFNIIMSQAVDLVFRAIENGIGGEIFIPKLKAYNLGTLVDSILEQFDSKVTVEKINVRIGEKFHESLISYDEIRNVYETLDDYILFESLDFKKYLNDKLNPKPAHLVERYSSDKVPLLTKSEICDMFIKENIF
jgi:UDP-N-acetylglucosamine 4,6-dehydratase/UDP-glucose 4-epimerase